MERVDTIGKTDEETDYNGWRNWESWNVAAWISNDEMIYSRAVFVAHHPDRYPRPFEALRDLVVAARHSSAKVHTPDGADWFDERLDVGELDEMITGMRTPWDVEPAAAEATK